MYENIDKIEYDTNKYFFLERYPQRLKYLQEINLIQEDLIKEHLKLIEMKIIIKPEREDLEIIEDNKIIDLYDKNNPKNKMLEEKRLFPKSTVNKCDYYNFFSQFIQIPSLLQVYLKQFNYNKLSSLQKLIIPNLFNKNDIFANTSESTGKTLSYLIPILSFLRAKESINKIKLNDKKSYPIVLIIGQNKEKLNRKLNECLKLTYETNILSVGISGDGGYNHIQFNFYGGCDILFTTLESLTYSLKNNLISLSSVKYLVFDTLDDILNEVDEKYIFRIFKKYDLGDKYKRTNIIFSGKYNNEVLNIANNILKKNHLIVKIKRLTLIEKEDNQISLNIPQKFYYVESGLFEDKLHQLKNILSYINGTRVIFVNKEKDYNLLKLKLNNILNDQNLFLTTDLESKKIKEKLHGKKIDFIINFDLPNSSYIYENRINFCGFYGRSITLIIPENGGMFKFLRTILTNSKQEIPEFLDLPKPKKKEEENKKKNEKKSENLKSEEKDKKSNKNKGSNSKTKTTKISRSKSKQSITLLKNNSDDKKRQFFRQKTTNISRERLIPLLNIEQIKKNNESRRNSNSNISHYNKIKTSRNNETERILDFSDSESKRSINKIKSVVLQNKKKDNDLSKMHFQSNKTILRKKMSNNDLSSFEVSKRISFKTKTNFQINENDTEKDNSSKRSMHKHKTNKH